jgi:hypothetical protein
VKPQHVVIWAALLLGLMMVGGAAVFLAPQLRLLNPPEVYSWLGIGVGVAAPVAGHAVRFTMRDDPRRFILSFALAEAGAMTGAIMWMLTGTTLALGGYVAGAIGLVSMYPGAPEDV